MSASDAPFDELPPAVAGFVRLSPDAVLVIDPEGQIAAANLPASQLLGVGQEVLVGQPMEAILPDWTKARSDAFRRNKGQLPLIMGGAHGLQTRAPGAMSVGVRLVALAGGADGHDVALLRDLSRSIRMRTLERSSQTWEETEERFRRAIRHSPVPMLIHDEDGHCLELSEGWTKYSGYSIEDMPTMADWTVRACREHREPIKQYMDSMLAIDGTVKNGEWEITTKDGGKRTWELFTTSLGTSSDGRKLLLATATDLTERRHAELQNKLLNLGLEKRVAERTAALEVAVKELENFSYSVSHDLRAPLRAITGYSKILGTEHGLQLDEEGQRLLQVIQSNTRHMAQLIDALLSYSRAGRRELIPMLVDVGELAREVFQDLMASVPERAVCLSVGDLPHARADLPLLRQALECLLDNAIKFTSKVAAAEVSITAHSDGSWTTYCISDNGCGFDMAYVGKLFGVFQRLHSRDEFDGTGVGLALVQRIVGRHGGAVSARAQLGHGATLSFSLPRPKFESGGQAHAS